MSWNSPTLFSCHHIFEFVSQWKLAYDGMNALWPFRCCACNSLSLSRWMFFQDLWCVITWLLLLCLDWPWLCSSHCLKGSLNPHQSVREEALLFVSWWSSYLLSSPPLQPSKVRQIRQSASSKGLFSSRAWQILFPQPPHHASEVLVCWLVDYLL